MNKTLIGKNDYLFLTNDSARELEVHSGTYKPIIKFRNFDLTKYFLTVFPNKSFMCKEFLPDGYDLKYRYPFEEYKNLLGNNILDGYELLKNEDSVFNKTDTHLNLKGTYIVYLEFIKQINKLFHLNIIPKEINIKSKICKLSDLHICIGDLTLKHNLGNQIIPDIIENYYYSDDFSGFQGIYKIIDNSNIRFLNKDFIDETLLLENIGEHAHWDIISKYIIYINNNNTVNNSYKVLIFHDSFLLNSYRLYFELFNEVYFCKRIYSDEIINKIKPDYIFEFRVERFLL